MSSLSFRACFPELIRIQTVDSENSGCNVRDWSVPVCKHRAECMEPCLWRTVRRCRDIRVRAGEASHQTVGVALTADAGAIVGPPGWVLFFGRRAVFPYPGVGNEQPHGTLVSRKLPFPGGCFKQWLPGQRWNLTLPSPCPALPSRPPPLAIPC
jgi:hypothetical protein